MLEFFCKGAGGRNSVIYPKPEALMHPLEKFLALFLSSQSALNLSIKVKTVSRIESHQCYYGTPNGKSFWKKQAVELTDLNYKKIEHVSCCLRQCVWDGVGGAGLMQTIE